MPRVFFSTLAIRLLKSYGAAFCSQPTQVDYPVMEIWVPCSPRENLKGLLLTAQVPDDDALILSFWLLGLAPSSLGLQELNFPGTGLSITRGRWWPSQPSPPSITKSTYSANKYSSVGGVMRKKLLYDKTFAIWSILILIGRIPPYHAMAPILMTTERCVNHIWSITFV